MSLARLGRMLTLVLMLGVGLAGTALAQESGTATVTVIHAVPGEAGFPADIYLNGAVLIDAMAFEGSSVPTELPAGETGLQIFEAGDDPTVAEAVLDQTITLDEGADYTVVAQLIDGSPAVALYLNDVSPVAAGGARLTVRQTSAEGPLDVALDGELIASALVAPNEVSFEVDAGAHPVLVSAADGQELLESEIDIPAGSLLVVYAVGSSEQDTFAILTQQVTTPQVTPAGVPTGTGGTRALASSAGWLVVPLIFVGAVLLAVRPRGTPKARA